MLIGFEVQHITPLQTRTLNGNTSGQLTLTCISADAEQTFTDSKYAGAWMTLADQCFGEVEHPVQDGDLRLTWHWNGRPSTERQYHYDSVKTSARGTHLLFHFHRLIHQLSPENEPNFDLKQWLVPHPMHAMLREVGSVLLAPVAEDDAIEQVAQQHNCSTSIRRRGAAHTEMVSVDLNLSQPMDDIDLEALFGFPRLKYMVSNVVRREYSPSFLDTDPFRVRVFVMGSVGSADQITLVRDTLGGRR